MADLLTLGISAAYAALAVLAAVLLVVSLRARRPGTPARRSVLLATGMACLLAQGLLLLVVILLGQLDERTFLLYSSILEVAGIAFFLAATLG